jgi:hypothetical protein
MLALLAIAVGLLAGIAAGGSPSGLAKIRIRFEAVLVVAFVAQGLSRGRFPGISSSSVGTLVWVAISLVLASVLLFNHRVPGMTIAAAGVLLNVDVVLANGSMPAAASGLLSEMAIQQRSAGFYHLAGHQTLGAWAGDVIRLGLLGQTYLVSAGDVLLAVGTTVVIACACLAESGGKSPVPGSRASGHETDPIGSQA